MVLGVCFCVCTQLEGNWLHLVLLCSVDTEVKGYNGEQKYIHGRRDVSLT